MTASKSVECSLNDQIYIIGSIIGDFKSCDNGLFIHKSNVKVPNEKIW